MNVDGTLNKLSGLAAEAIGNRIFPGCAFGVVTREGQRGSRAVGAHTYDPDAAPVSTDSVYDVASVTKAIPVSTLALRAIGEGRLELATPLIEWAPEYGAVQRDAVTVWHLLTHTIQHGVRLSELKELPAEAIIARIMESDLLATPGESFHYANATSILLGILLERLYDSELHLLARRTFWEPMGMEHTWFSCENVPTSKAVPTERDGDTIIRGVVHDESARVLSTGRAVGSAGLFSTVDDLLTFLEMMLNFGAIDGVRCVDENVVSRASENQIARLGLSTGLGWELNRNSYMGETCSARTIGKTGFTGCHVVCDLDKGIGLVLLANRIWPRRQADRSGITRVRHAFGDVVFDRV